MLSWIQAKNKELLNNTDTPTNKKHKTPPQFLWESNSTTLFKKQLLLSQSQTKIENLMNFIPSLTKKGIDKFPSDSQNIILYAAKSSLKIKKKKYVVLFLM